MESKRKAKNKSNRGKSKAPEVSNHSSKRAGSRRIQPVKSEQPVNGSGHSQAEMALREPEERYPLLQGILQSTSDGILAVNQENEVLFANERFGEMWRIPQEIMASKDDTLLLQYVLDQLSDPRGFLRKVNELYNSAEESFDTLYFKDGRVFERLSRPMLHGIKLRGRVWSFRDITERRRTEQTLQEAEAKYRILVEQIPAAIYLWELGDAGRCHYISPRIETMLGFSVDKWLTDPDLFFRQVHPNDRERALAAEKHSRNTGEPLHSEFRMLTREGRVIWVHDESVVLPDNPNQPRLNQGVLMDITGRKQAEEELRSAKDELESINLELQRSLEREKLLACSDGLTGLCNRRHFFELAGREFQAAVRHLRPLTLLMFDIDNFKQVNDTLGHTIGDKLLLRVAQTAIAQVRASDVVARYGGDEFIVMLPYASAQQALPIAERIRANVATIRVETDNDPLTVTLSIGIAEMQHEPVEENIEHVIQRADDALYKAKQSGRNRTVIFG